jgi:PAS domain S-box-containing protein
MTRPKPSAIDPDNPLDKGLIRRSSLILSIAAGVVMVATYLTNDNRWNALPAALLALVGGLGVIWSNRGNQQVIAAALVFSAQLTAVISVFAYGSVRVASTLMFVASVAAAGIFLSKRALITSVVSSVSALGVLSLLERQGFLNTPSFKVDFLTWAIYTCVLLVVGVIVYHAREQTRLAFALQRKALKENRALTMDRDRHLERFARIFRTNPAAMITQSAATAEILDVNPAFERCYGYMRDEVIGKTDHFLWGRPEQRDDYLSNLGRLPRVDQFSIVGKRADGSHFDAYICSELSSDEDDMLVITTVTDMTSQNQVVERLRRSEERFSKAFNLSPLLTTITRMSDGTFLEVNQSGDVLPGIPVSELKGRSTHSMGLWMSEEDRKRYIEQLQTEGHVEGFEATIKRPDGAAIDLRIWAVPIEIEGEACILSCSANITEEKRRNDLLLDIAKGMTGPTAQAFFHALTERMVSSLGADMVFIGEITADGSIHTLAAVNRQGKRLDNFRFPVKDSVCEEALAQRGHLALETNLHRNLQVSALYPGGSFQAGVYQALHDTDGTPIGILSALWSRPIQVTDEMRALMTIFSSRSTAELMRLRSERETERLNNSLEMRVQARTAELRKLNAELDSFAYSISHDLKSPLRAIDGFTQLLHERLHDRLSDEERGLMDRVLGATHRMGNLMADLLDLTRVSQDTINLRTIDLSQLARGIVKSLNDRAPRPSLKWEIQPDMSVRCDERLMRIALENLFENAQKFTRDQPAPLIEFGLDTSTTPPWFFIRDNGVGFSMAHADKLFKPFQRLQMPSAGFEGTGIGLATVRRIIERHGGSIHAQGIEGQGAVFRFQLDSLPEAGPPQAMANGTADRLP